MRTTGLPYGPTRRDFARFALTAAVALEPLAWETAASRFPNLPVIKHAGMLHTTADLDRINSKMTAGVEPWKSGWENFEPDPHASIAYTRHPRDIVYRGLNATGHGHFDLNSGGAAAYCNAMAWSIAGDEPHAKKAIESINAWFYKLSKSDAGADRYLALGIYGYQ